MPKNEKYLWPISKNLTNTVLCLIEKQRVGEAVDENLIRDILNVFQKIGEDFELQIYKQEFEKLFLETTEVFYERESEEFLASHSVPEYMVLVERRLKEEKYRAENFLHPSTWEPLKATCQRILLQEHLEKSNTAFNQLLMEEKEEDLTRMFELISEIPGGVNKFYKFFENFVIKNGREELQKHGEAVITDAKLYSTTILDVHKKYSDFVRTVWNNNEEFSKALKDACTKFIETNHVTKAPNCSSDKSPEHLANYCHIILKSADHIEEGHFDQIITILNMIQNIDIFQVFYKRCLAKRLISNQLMDTEMESTLLLKLKKAFGSNFMIHMEKMIEDHTISKSLLREYLKNSNEKLEMNFEAIVTTVGIWPSISDEKCVLPIELERSQHMFQSFYNSKHKNRVLKGVNVLSKGELTARFDKSYTLRASTFQTVILFQFNSADSLTVKQLYEATEIKMELLLNVLQTLLKSTLLKSKDSAKLGPSSIVELNHHYRNKKRLVNLNAPLKSSEKEQKEADTLSVNQQRQFETQAAIVRIMKREKKLSRQQLIAAVIDELKTRFKVDLEQFKKYMKNLIERDFIEEEGSGIYNYVL
ncbi:CUL1 [Cordylochernes scorpioides]|uniref:CUL1 n=1 Tax=Cordylochernes scorpioides TaxID=51811 RepID=A0ABY6K8E9_9ARAC|nr:CUL1 [Cordylochernes scorpioides]